VDKAGRVTIDTIKAYADIEVSRSNPVNQGFNTSLQDRRNTHETSKEEVSPQLGEFLKDAAIMAAVMSLLDLFVNRT
jgi:preprotein translocase subunit SecF